MFISFRNKLRTVKRLPTMRETRVRSLGWEDPLEKEMAIHSSTIAWKIPWTEEPGRLLSMGSQRVGHDWATSHAECEWFLFNIYIIKANREGNGNPLQYSCLENSMDREAWQSAVHGVARVECNWVTNTIKAIKQQTKVMGIIIKIIITPTVWKWSFSS